MINRINSGQIISGFSMYYFTATSKWSSSSSIAASGALDLSGNLISSKNLFKRVICKELIRPNPPSFTAYCVTF
jgi:hypothetical protein